MSKHIFSIFVLFLILSSGSALAMGSDNYKIDKDVIGAFGAPGSSDSYDLNDTGGEVGTGNSASDNFKDLAGFWQMMGDYKISIGCPSLVSMGSITGTGKSDLTNNHADCTVITDNPAGYKLDWTAGNSNMLNANNDAILAYVPGTVDVPEIWQVTSSSTGWGGHLGATSTTVDTSVWGTADTYAGGKWLNVSTSGFTIAERHSATSQSGDDEYVFFGAEIGSNKFQPTGTYTVNVTLTATTL